MAQLHFGACFDIDQDIPRGSHGFDLEADSVPLRVADILVGNGIGCASTFERDRVGKVFCLCRRPISVSQGPGDTDAYHIRCRRHLSAAVGFRQTTPDRLRPVRPSAS
jgi:hypothetical protein